MKTIGIIQPGRLGDIILCLPIAKYYYDQGYKVIWPIFSQYINMFEEVVDYVEFIAVTGNIYTCVSEAKHKTINCTKILDIAATFPDSTCTDRYVEMGDGLGEIKADHFKYIVSEVPIKHKWNLSIKRNSVAEDNLYNQYVTQPDYVVGCLTSSQGKLDIKFDTKGRQFIEMNEKHSIFHWLKILENAKVLALVNSSVSNLVEMLNFTTKKILLPRQDGRLPTLKNEGQTIYPCKKVY